MDKCLDFPISNNLSCFIYVLLIVKDSKVGKKEKKTNHNRYGKVKATGTKEVNRKQEKTECADHVRMALVSGNFVSGCTFICVFL